MINSIKKGKSFERELANKLTELTNCKWNRVPMSGAFSTNNSSENPIFNGDVFCENEKYKSLCIECKATKEIIELTSIFNHNSTLSKFIHQAQYEAKGNDWILFVKVNGRKVFYICEFETFKPERNSDFVNSYCIIDKYKDIFENSIPICYGSYYLGILQ